MLCTSVILHAQDIPILTAYVNDHANVLSAGDKEKLEAKLKSYNDTSSSQIAILIVPSIGEMPITEYSLKVAEKAALGQKGKDNGVLITLVIDSHDWRIETGYGVEGALPDASCNFIGRNILVPKLQEDTPDFYGGLDKTTDAITQALAGEFESLKAEVESEEKFSVFWKVLLGIAAVVGLLGGAVEKHFFAATVCAAFFLIAYLFTFGLASIFVAFLMVPIGFVTGFVSCFVVPIMLSGGGSGSGSGKGSSGGGFSGGGGGFGGGGSSGKW